jgi:galactosyl transferase GMA12/MNN10 family
MTELPPCRWRESLGDGTHRCHSRKFVCPPNRVATDFCRACTYVDHEDASEPRRLDAEVPSAKGTIALATLYTPEIADYGRPAAEAVRAYARRHGYRSIIATESLDRSRPPSWSKLLLVERYLTENPDCEWLMWIDADAVISRPAQSLENLLDPNADLLVAEDVPPSPINLGVFLIRNCAAALELIRRAYARTEYIHHPWWEQPAVVEAMREMQEELRVRIVPRRLLNSFAAEHQADHFVIHFAGRPHAEKAHGVKRAIRAAETAPRRARAATEQGAGAGVTINGLWMERRFSRLEKLSVLSFLRFGYRYRLWSYAPIENAPDGIEICDARTIVPEDHVFAYGRFGAHRKVQGFSDLFRYRLLHLCGGWWADLDVTLLRPLPVVEYSLAKHWNGMVGNVMHAPRGCPWMAESAERCRQLVGPDNADWHLPINLMLEVLRREKVPITVTNFGGDHWHELERLIRRPGAEVPDWDGIHWCNSVWAPEKERPIPGTVYARLLAEHEA